MENIGGSLMVQPGRWVNIHTNDVVMVRDTIQDGEQMLVITDKGQIPMKNFSNYIQVEEGEIIPTLNDLYGNKSNNLQSLINQGLPEEDRIKVKNNSNRYDKLTKGLGTNINEQKENNNIKNETKQIEKQEPKQQENKNYDLIKKVFDKFPIERSIEFSIIEEEWPFKEFNMLVNILDVPVEDICSYVIDNYLDKNNLVKALTEYFQQFIK